MDKEWYLSCPHACSDPDTCPYGRNHLPKIEALLRKIERLKAQLAKKTIDDGEGMGG